MQVLVLNGVDPTKAIAKPAAAGLAAIGYNVLAPRDARTTVAASAVYYLPDFEADARAIAARLGVPPNATQTLALPAPPALGDVATAEVVIVIGPDIPSATGTTAN